MSITSSKRYISLLAGPLACCFVVLFLDASYISPHATKVLALATWMIIWWITEAVPIPVTAILPLIYFPFTGVMKIADAAAPYGNHIIFLFMGGFMIALALEKHRLHERIALNLIRITGTSGNGIIAGFMIATGFLSMWISNTATAMMMLPIAMSVYNLVHKTGETLAVTPSAGERNFGIALMLIISTASNIGGIATIIGTPPNVVFAGLLDQFYHQKLDFGKWMMVGFPLMVALLALTYLIVVIILFPNGIKKIKGSDELIQTRLKELGKLSREEKLVIAIFSITCFLWILQQPINLLLKSEMLNDTNVAMLGGSLMFILPTSFKKPKFLLEWEDTRNMAWGILILFGGGLCLAKGLSDAQIIQLVGKTIAEQSSSTTWLLLGLITAAVFITELMSNVALVQIFIPVVFGIAANTGMNPILLGMPVTIGASMAFMFPVATPPNAIVFSSGYLQVKDMMKAGIWLNIVSILLIYLASVTLIEWVYL